MGFNLTAPLASIILKLSSGGIESVANRHINISVRRVFAWFVTFGEILASQFGIPELGRLEAIARAVNHQLSAGNFEIDANQESFAFVVMAVRRFNDHVAT